MRLEIRMTGGEPGRGPAAPEERLTPFRRRVLRWGGGAIGAGLGVVALVGAWDALVGLPAAPSPLLLRGALILVESLATVLLGGGLFSIMLLVCFPVMLLHADRMQRGLHGAPHPTTGPLADALRRDPAFGPTAGRAPDPAARPVTGPSAERAGD